MTTRLRLGGWEARGLRCPDHSISFSQGAEQTVYPITLLQMPNGTGKTTTLNLLRAALSGAALTNAWDEHRIRSLAKKGNADPSGSFRVILFLNERRISISMEFDFENGSVSYHTTLPSGMKKGFHPPSEISAFFKPDFVNFFVFDGELADNLISPDHTDAQTAIDDLFQLRHFLILRRHVTDYWEDKVSGRTATEEKGLTRRRNRVRNLRERIDKLESRRRRLGRQLEGTTEKLATMEERFKDALDEQKEHRKRLAKAQEELGKAEDAVSESVARIVALIKNPCSLSHVVAERIGNLKSSLDQAQLPESAAREFFTELANQEECVCGRHLDEEARRRIGDRAAQYMGSEDVALLNAMKSEIGDQLEPTPQHQEYGLRDRMEELAQAVHRSGQLRTRRDAIEAQAAAGDPDLEAAREKIAELREEKTELEHKVKRFDDPTDTASDEDTVGLTVLKRRLTEAEDALAEITDTLSLKEKRDTLLKILERSHDLARSALSQEICKEANERIETLMPENDIRIRKIDQCLELEGQESGSTGENLSVAYSFLSTLFSRAEHRLPFVVDSPANPIDLRVRRAVAELIPKLSDQFVAFTISSEKQGFLEPLQTAAPGDIQYLTMYRKGNPEVEAPDNATGEVHESQDGIVVHGPRFFESFHIDEEE